MSRVSGMASGEFSSRAPLRQAWQDSLGGIVAVLSFGAFINLLKFTMPLYTLQVLDRIPGSHSVETLVMLTLIAVPAVLSGVALEAVRSRMFGTWGGWIERRFGPMLVSAGFRGGVDRGAVIADEGLKDLRTLRGFVESAAAPLLDLMWTPFFIFAVYLIHPYLCVVMSGAMVLRLLVALLQEVLIREPRRAAGSARDEARDIVSNARRQVDTVAALGMAGNLTRRWRESLSSRQVERGRAAPPRGLTSALAQGLYRSLYVGGMGLGVWLLILGELTIGGVIAGNIILRFGFRLVDRGARRWRMLTRATAAYRRLKERLDGIAPSVASAGEADLDAPLRIEGVSYRYPGGREAVLKRLDLNLQRGELLSVMGPSGSGKSTLAQLLVGRLQPRHGQILLGNVAVARLPESVRSRAVGYLAQEGALFDGSVRENIARMGRGDLDAVIDAARLAGVHELVVRLPQGYDTPLDNAASGLSVGQKKRIALARAFYGRPRLVVLDEPEAALDRQSRRVLKQALQTLRAGGATLVITTQSGSLARSADRALILGGDRPQLVEGKDAVSPVAGLADVADLQRRRADRPANGPGNPGEVKR